MISLLIPSISGPSLPFPCLLYFLSSLCLASFFIRTNHHCTIIVNLYSHFATASVSVCVCSTTFVKYPKDLYFSMNRIYCLSVQFECYELYKRICLTISMFFFSSLWVGGIGCRCCFEKRLKLANWNSQSQNKNHFYHRTLEPRIRNWCSLFFMANRMSCDFFLFLFLLSLMLSRCMN